MIFIATNRKTHPTAIAMFNIIILSNPTNSASFTMKNRFFFIVIPEFANSTIIPCKLSLTFNTLIRLRLNFLTQKTSYFSDIKSVHFFNSTSIRFSIFLIVTKSTRKFLITAWGKYRTFSKIMFASINLILF